MTVPGREEPTLSLAAEFPPATRDAWRDLVSAVLAKSGAAKRDGAAADLPLQDPERALASRTYDGFDLAPLYTSDDVPSDLDAAGLPGQPPFVRGASAHGAAATGWDVRQCHLDPDPVRLNRALLSDLENGASSVWLVLGSRGLAVTDLSEALHGVYLDLAPIALDAGAETTEAATMLLSIAAQRAVDPAGLRGTLGADPIGLLARTGTEADLGMLAALVNQVAASPELRVAEVDATVYHEAGGSDSDEIAIATAVGVAYLRALTDDGVGLAEALQRMEFRFAVTANQFSSIAKLRAARRLWSRVAELSGAATPGAQPSGQGAGAQRQHAVTSAAMLTRRDPWVNMLRTTIGCFAAAVGGAETITVLPFDSAIGLSDDFARRIARNTQSVLHDEASLARVIDPAGGSYYAEALTDQLAQVAWEKFTAIERAGGALAALRSGHIPQLLESTRNQREQAIAHRTDVITGVSEFAFVAEPPMTRPPRPAPVDEGALLPVIRYAAAYEELRDRSDAEFARTGRRPTVFLAGLGPLVAHSARLGFAANLLQAGGIEAVIGTADGASGLDPAALVAQFRASGSTVSCLCSSDRVYADQAAPAARALKAAGAKAVLLVGEPGDRAGSDAESGIDGHVFAGCNALDVLSSVLADLEVA
jgi:methylmalonyl-CoA mutase